MHTPKNVYDNKLPSFPECPKCGAQVVPNEIVANHEAVCDYILFVTKLAPARGLHSLEGALARDEARWVAAILDDIGIEHRDFHIASGNGYAYEIWAPEAVLLACRSYKSHREFAEMDLREYLERMLHKDENPTGD